MAVPGALFGSQLGYDLSTLVSYIANSGISVSYTMTTTANLWCARLVANSTKDIKAVKISWGTAGTASVDVRVETIDATTGKPTGTLYDANATVSITPSAGTQTATFATLPTAGRTAGTAYAIVLKPTSVTSAPSLRSSGSNNGRTSGYPAAVLTSSDTGATWTEVASNVPCVSLVLEDDTEETEGAIPLATCTSNSVYGTLGVASKIVIPSNVTVTPAGIGFCYSKNGTPPGDLRLRIFDNSNNVVTNSTITVDKDFLVTNGNNNRGIAYFDTPPTLTAGTYRIVADSASSDSSNYYNFRSTNALSSGNVPSGFNLSTCPDVGTPVWTDTNTAMVALTLVVDSVSGSGGGGGTSNSCIIGQGGFESLGVMGLVGAGVLASSKEPEGRRGFLKKLGLLAMPWRR